MSDLLINRQRPFDFQPYAPNANCSEITPYSIGEHDERMTSLLSIDPDRILLVSMLHDDEEMITSKENLKRMKEENFIRLDHFAFRTVWENQYVLPSRWVSEVKQEGSWPNLSYGWIYFDGVVFVDCNGFTQVLRMRWDDGCWFRQLAWRGDGWAGGAGNRKKRHFSAVYPL